MGGSHAQDRPHANATFVGFTDAGGFTSITVAANVNGPFAIDNMSFEAATVPEPASVVLMLTGLLGVGVAARRRKAAD